jgi:hypothetical protein
MNDVAGKFSEAERKLCAEIEESSDRDENGAEDQEHTAEFAEGIHKSII